MQLYPKSQESLTDEIFLNPTSEYRGAPFWAWNCRMTPEKIDEMVEMFRKMGMGGAHIHPRTGMSNEYMSEEYLELVKKAQKAFKERQMITWLYDEDRWPSGFGGGLVTREEKYRSRFLVFTPECLEGKNVKGLPGIPGPSSRSDRRRLLARYQVCLDDGWLKSYKMLGDGEQVDENGQEWFAYLEISGTSPRFKNQS